MNRVLREAERAFQIVLESCGGHCPPALVRVERRLYNDTHIEFTACFRTGLQHLWYIDLLDIRPELRSYALDYQQDHDQCGRDLAALYQNMSGEYFHNYHSHRRRAAVAAFQEAHGLPADGIVGPNTTAALERAHTRAQIDAANLAETTAWAQAVYNAYATARFREFYTTAEQRRGLWARLRAWLGPVEPIGRVARVEPDHQYFFIGGINQTPVRDQKAVRKGMKLFRSWLTPEQLAQFKKNDFFDVIGSDSGKRYRIRHGRQMNVYEIDKKGETVTGLCFVPQGALVEGDVMLAQKIALETDERAALAVANRFGGHEDLVVRVWGAGGGSASYVSHARDTGHGHGHGLSISVGRGGSYRG